MWSTPAQDRLELVHRFITGDKDLFFNFLKGRGDRLKFDWSETRLFYTIHGGIPRLKTKSVDQPMLRSKRRSHYTHDCYRDNKKIYNMQEENVNYSEDVIGSDGPSLADLTEDYWLSLEL